MSTYYQIECPHCSNPNDINEVVCSSCGLPIPGTINVRRASLPQELLSLEVRYADAKNYLKSNNLTAEGDQLESSVKTNGKAVINTQFNFLWEWLIRNKFAYESYRRQLINGARMKAKFENDVNRTLADSILFGSTIDIIYSALSIDEEGVISYGDITIILNSGAIEKRTSALEKNSFFFINDIVKKGWLLNTALPAGYMAVWEDIFKLSISKLYLTLRTGLAYNNIARLILDSSGNRSSDEFIELYIYGKIVASTIKKIKIPLKVVTKFNPKEQLRLKELQAKYNVECY